MDGTPDADVHQSRSRVANLYGWSKAEVLLHLNIMPSRFVAAVFNARSLAARAVDVVPGMPALDDLGRHTGYPHERTESRQ